MNNSPSFILKVLDLIEEQENDELKINETDLTEVSLYV
jgi:hypothetical protein